MSLLILVLSFAIAAQSHADLASSFKELDSERKGPFTVNYLQHTKGRGSLGSTATDGCMTFGGASGSLLFQAAARNKIAQTLANDFDFYVANLFTTNYYQLMGEYVYGDPCGNHALDHAALAEKSSEALPKLASMTRHFVLERYYDEYFPNSAIAKGFNLRGIAGSEFEQEYAEYYFDLYLSAMNEEFQFLPAYLLLKESPIGSSSELNRARQLIADSYTYFENRFCGGSRCSDERVQRLWVIRNSIHNQLSQDVIALIDAYVEDFDFYKKEGHTYLFTIRDILVAYYSFSADKIAEHAKKANQSEIRAIAEDLHANGVTIEKLLALSNEATSVRAELTDTNTLVLISAIAQFLDKEVNNMEEVTSVDVIKILLNTIYLEGFLIRDNWQYFLEEVSATSDVQAAASMLTDVVDIAQATLDQAFSPALEQWISLEPEMQNFVDNTIKSSSLNTASILAEELRK